MRNFQPQRSHCGAGAPHRDGCTRPCFFLLAPDHSCLMGVWGLGRPAQECCKLHLSIWSENKPLETFMAIWHCHIFILSHESMVCNRLGIKKYTINGSLQHRWFQKHWARSWKTPVGSTDFCLRATNFWMMFKQGKTWLDTHS